MFPIEGKKIDLEMTQTQSINDFDPCVVETVERVVEGFSKPEPDKRRLLLAVLAVVTGNMTIKQASIQHKLPTSTMHPYIHRAKALLQSCNPAPLNCYDRDMEFPTAIYLEAMVNCMTKRSTVDEEVQAKVHVTKITLESLLEQSHIRYGELVEKLTAIASKAANSLRCDVSMKESLCGVIIEALLGKISSSEGAIILGLPYSVVHQCITRAMTFIAIAAREENLPIDPRPRIEPAQNCEVIQEEKVIPRQTLVGSRKRKANVARKITNCDQQEYDEDDEQSNQIMSPIKQIEQENKQEEHKKENNNMEIDKALVDKLLNFQADVTIEKRVIDLIGREYMQLSEEERARYMCCACMVLQKVCSVPQAADIMQISTSLLTKLVCDVQSCPLTQELRTTTELNPSLVNSPQLVIALKTQDLSVNPQKAEKSKKSRKKDKSPNKPCIINFTLPTELKVPEGVLPMDLKETVTALVKCSLYADEGKIRLFKAIVMVVCGNMLTSEASRSYRVPPSTIQPYVQRAKASLGLNQSPFNSPKPKKTSKPKNNHTKAKQVSPVITTDDSTIAVESEHFAVPVEESVAHLSHSPSWSCLSVGDSPHPTPSITPPYKSVSSLVAHAVMEYLSDSSSSHALLSVITQYLNHHNDKTEHTQGLIVAPIIPNKASNDEQSSVMFDAVKSILVCAYNSLHANSTHSDPMSSWTIAVDEFIQCISHAGIPVVEDLASQLIDSFASPQSQTHRFPVVDSQ